MEEPPIRVSGATALEDEEAGLMRVETRVSASLQHQDARVETRVSASLQYQGARVETRVSVITALVIGSITAHIMRKLTPIMERF